jgi:hypothetical protein
MKLNETQNKILEQVQELPGSEYSFLGTHSNDLASTRFVYRNQTSYFGVLSLGDSSEMEINVHRSTSANKFFSKKFNQKDKYGMIISQNIPIDGSHKRADALRTIVNIPLSAVNKSEGFVALDFYNQLEKMYFERYPSDTATEKKDTLLNGFSSALDDKLQSIQGK